MKNKRKNQEITNRFDYNSIEDDPLKIKEIIEDENVHHIFKIPEVRAKIIEIFGEPKNSQDFILISKEVEWVWKNLPKYRLPMNKHKLIHIEQCKRPRELKYAIINNDKKVEKIKNNGEKLAESKEKILELLEENKFLKERIKTLEKLNYGGFQPSEVTKAGKNTAPPAN